MKTLKDFQKAVAEAQQVYNKFPNRVAFAALKEAHQQLDRAKLEFGASF